MNDRKAVESDEEAWARVARLYRKELPITLAMMVLISLLLTVLNPLNDIVVANWTVIEWHNLYTSILFVAGVVALIAYVTVATRRSTLFKLILIQLVVALLIYTGFEIGRPQIKDGDGYKLGPIIDPSSYQHK